MDIITQRFIAIGNKLLVEFRHIRDVLGVLHADNQQQIETINAAQERKQEQQAVRPIWLDDILSKYDQAERNRAANDKRHYYVQNSIRWATWCAFLAAAFYGAIAYRQWTEMILATETTQQAVKESRLNRQQSEKYLDATIQQFHLDQRAWVGAGDPTFTMNETSPFRVETQAANVGKTPALEVLSKMTVKPEPKDKAFTVKDISYPATMKEKSNGTIFPGQHFPVISTTANEAILDNQSTMVKVLSQGDFVMYVFGVIDYKDVFSQPHWTHFCYVVNKDLKTAKPCGFYNDSDPSTPSNK